MLFTVQLSETHFLLYALFFEFEYWYGLYSFYQCLHKKYTLDTCYEYVEEIITKNQPNVLAPAIHDFNVVCFQFFTILNKINRLTFTTRKAIKKEITPPVIICSKSTKYTLEHGVKYIQS